MGSRQFWETRFVSQLEQALITPELLALPEVQRNLVWVSADATPTCLGAVDWSAKVAIAYAAGPLLKPLETERPCCEDSEAHTGPGDDLVQIGVAELLALLVLVAARKEAWAGSVVLYLGDNMNVQDWLRRRQAGNAQANLLLKVLGALEGVYGIQIRGAYLRTYHNQTADDLTRLDPDEVMSQQGLVRIKVPDDWSQVLEEAWHHRALLWLGQPESDRQVALQLATRRAGPAPPRAMPAYGWTIHELGPNCPGVYTRAFFAAGGLRHDLQDMDDTKLLCVATVSGEAEARKMLSSAPHHASSIWIDSYRPLSISAVCSQSSLDIWEWHEQEFSGRSFQEQVWWKRWVLAGTKPGCWGEAGVFLDSKRAALEPHTPLLHTYATYWVDPKPRTGWVTGVVHLDPTFPFLGLKPLNPVGRSVPREGRALLFGTPPGPSPRCTRVLGTPRAGMLFTCWGTGMRGCRLGL